MRHPSELAAPPSLSTRRPFLTARWTDLVLATWALDPAQLKPFLAPGLTLDTWEGAAHASFVAFDFRDTRVLGFKIPFHVNFPEINLRLYVKDPAGRRGVTFVRELVPSPFVAGIARLAYNEPYVATPMKSSVREDAQGRAISHRFKWRGEPQTLEVLTASNTWLPSDTGMEHHFKEHSWGFGRSRSGALQTYRVDHPVWEVHEVRKLSLQVDFAAVYGPTWAELSRRAPDSVIVAAGSAVSVHPLEGGARV